MKFPILLLVVVFLYCLLMAALGIPFDLFR